MKIQGTVKWVGAPQGGTSQRTGNQWRKQEVEIEYGSQEYPEQIVASAFNSPNIGAFAIGQQVECDIYFHTHDYNGRKYNDINMSHDRILPPASSQQGQAPAAPRIPQGGATENDLPF